MGIHKIVTLVQHEHHLQLFLDTTLNYYMLEMGVMKGFKRTVLLTYLHGSIRSFHRLILFLSVCIFILTRNTILQNSNQENASVLLPQRLIFTKHIHFQLVTLQNQILYSKLYCGPNGPTASIFDGIRIKQSGAMVFICNLDKVLLKKLFPTMNI